MLPGSVKIAIPEERQRQESQQQAMHKCMVAYGYIIRIIIIACLLTVLVSMGFFLVFFLQEICNLKELGSRPCAIGKSTPFDADCGQRQIIIP
mgnify:CR=1 FL=1